MKKKLLMITIGESDRWEDMPLYEAIARKLIQLKAPGATVQRGIMGFGSHQKRLHHGNLFGFADDRPITILVAHGEDELRNHIIPEVRAMMKHGLMMLVDAEIVPHKHDPPPTAH